MVTLPPSPPAPLVLDSSASPAVLDRALTELGQLREDLQGANSHLVAGRLELIFGWVHSDSYVQAALSRAATTSEEEKQAATQAAAARDAALKDSTVTQDRCKALEAKLQGLRNELAKEACDRQAKVEEMKAREDAIGDHDAELTAKGGRLGTLE